MTPERWQRVEEVFRAALDCPPPGRLGYVEEACRDDSDLRREVVSLLAAHDGAGSFLDAPPASPDDPPPARLFLPDQMVAERFRVLRFIAEGGMGEVYEALDTELGERVALKTVRQSILDADDAEERFLRESQLARKISHPNVCRIHDVFHHTVRSGSYETKIRFLTMELLEGENLARRLRRGGPLTVERALVLARQIASALRAAHAAGVVHRDVKPENVMLVPGKGGQRAVVTDFGLARACNAFEAFPVKARGDLLWILHGLQAGRHGPKGALARAARRARRQMAALGIVSDPRMALTELGRILGTPAYMAPEQARGERADERADIWSFGMVCYEMLTGRLPYRPESSIGGLARKLFGRRRRPTPLPRRVPAALRKVISRCLEVRPEKRYATMEEVVWDLDRIEPEAPSAARLWLLGLGAGLLLALVAWVVLRGL